MLYVSVGFLGEKIFSTGTNTSASEHAGFFFVLLMFLLTAALYKCVWRMLNLDVSMMLCKSYSTYERYDAKHVLFDNSVFCSVFRNKILRGWCSLRVCALDGLFWDRQFVLFIFQTT